MGSLYEAKPPQLPADSDRSIAKLWRDFRYDVADVFDRYGKRTSQQHKRLVIFILLAGIGLRGFMLFAPITQEEAYAYMTYSTRSVGTIVSDYAHPENHVFHSLLAKASTALFGAKLWSLRLPAFFAGIVALPLFYLFARAMFNRYIALLALALLAGSGALIEQGTLARGQAIGWLCMTAALVFGRHMALGNNRLSGILVGVVCAFGTWSVTSMVHAVALIYLWLLFYLATRYKGTLNRRLITLFWSLLTYIGLSVVLYMPILFNHGLGQMIIHPDLPRADWSVFMEAYPEAAYDLWEWLVDTSAEWFAYAGIAAMIYAGYISGKYRMMIIALALGAIPLVLVRALVAPPADWLYILFFVYLGMAIGLYYLLRTMQEKLGAKLGKRSRTAIASIVLLVGTAWPGMLVIQQRVPRFPDAGPAAMYLKAVMAPGDRIFVDRPWSDPVRFHALGIGLGKERFDVGPAPGGEAYVLVAKVPVQTVQGVLEHTGSSIYAFDSWEMVKDRGGMEIFAARLREEASSEEDR